MRYVGSNWGTISFTVPYVYEVRRIYSLLEWNFTWGGFNELRIQLLVASKVQVQVVALRPNVSTKVSKAPTRKEFRQGPPEPWLLAKCPKFLWKRRTTYISAFNSYMEPSTHWLASPSIIGAATTISEPWARNPFPILSHQRRRWGHNIRPIQSNSLLNTNQQAHQRQR